MSKTKKKKQKVTTPSIETTSSVRVLLVFAIILLVVVFLTAVITGKIRLGSSGKANSHDVSYQTTEILAGQTFDQKEEQYLVLFYDGRDDKESSMYQTLLSHYQNKDGALAYYLVNMGSEFNRIYRVSSADEMKLDTNDASLLRIASPVLVEVRNKEIVNTWNENQVVEYFTHFGK